MGSIGRGRTAESRRKYWPVLAPLFCAIYVATAHVSSANKDIAPGSIQKLEHSTTPPDAANTAECPIEIYGPPEAASVVHAGAKLDGVTNVGEPEECPIEIYGPPEAASIVHAGAKLDGVTNVGEPDTKNVVSLETVQSNEVSGEECGAADTEECVTETILPSSSVRSDEAAMKPDTTTSLLRPAAKESDESVAARKAVTNRRESLEDVVVPFVTDQHIETDAELASVADVSESYGDVAAPSETVENAQANTELPAAASAGEVAVGVRVPSENNHGAETSVVPPEGRLYPVIVWFHNGAIGRYIDQSSFELMRPGDGVAPQRGGPNQCCAKDGTLTCPLDARYGNGFSSKCYCSSRIHVGAIVEGLPCNIGGMR